MHSLSKIETFHNVVIFIFSRSVFCSVFIIKAQEQGEKEKKTTENQRLSDSHEYTIIGRPQKIYIFHWIKKKKRMERNGTEQNMICAIYSTGITFNAFMAINLCIYDILPSSIHSFQRKKKKLFMMFMGSCFPYRNRVDNKKRTKYA